MYTGSRRWTGLPLVLPHGHHHPLYMPQNCNLSATIFAPQTLATVCYLSNSLRQRPYPSSIAKMEEEGGDRRRDGPIFRDIRRYNCQYCGITRSKKTLITSHILSHHQDKIEEVKADGKGDLESESGGVKLNTCEDCGVSFQKPAHLKQHMQSHSLERPFTCPLDDCHSSYRRKDHLSRHMLQHEGKQFECPNCNLKFAFQGNMTRHMREFHEESSTIDIGHPKQYVCSEAGCGKAFKYPSKLRKHEDSHVKLDAMEVFCAEPGCMKYFTNEQYLKAHLQSCHQHITCEICGTKQLKKNIKRHLRTHEKGDSKSERLKCTFKDCDHTFSTKSNLDQHIKAVHLEQKPFICSIAGCGMRFPFKHVRDNHEKSACHLYTPGDFVESDEHFLSRPRGGRKRECPPVIETLMRKRVVSPSKLDSKLCQASDYLSWMLGMSSEQPH